MSRPEPTGSRIDVERLLDEHRRRHRSLCRAFTGAEVELYVRESETLRVSGDASRKVTVRDGNDRGSAVRAFDADGAEQLFRCSTSSDLDDLVPVGDRAERHALPASSAPVAAERTEPLLDIDPDIVWPDAGSLINWLEQARDHVEEATSGRAAGIASAWTEAGVTREIWTGRRGEQTLRVRARGWAMAQPDHGSGPTVPTPRPWFVASRDWRRLEERGWADRAAAARPVSSTSMPPRVGVPVVIRPDAAASLVDAISRIWDPIRFPVGLEIGPAWNLSEEPLEPGALHGSSFDDEGQACGRVDLAREGRVVGHLPVLGHRRRGSFRDRPRIGPSHPVILPPPTSLPPEFLEFQEVGLQPLADDSWLLRASGGFRSGSQAWRIDDLILSVAPLELVRRCAGGLGEPVATHKGGRCPALLFEGLLGLG